MCDTAYFGWVGSLRFSFPMEMLDPIRKAAFGFLDDLKVMIKTGAGEFVDKVKTKMFGGSIQEVDPDTTNKEVPSPNPNV